MVLTHARALIRSATGGEVSCIEGDIGDADAIIKQAGATLDFRQPIVVMLMSALAHVASAAAAREVVSALMAAVPSGSYLAIYHLASDLDPALTKALKHWNAVAPKPMTLRSRTEVLALLDGLELVPPGVVPVHAWGCAREEGRVPVHGAVARRP